MTTDVDKALMRLQYEPNPRWTDREVELLTDALNALFPNRSWYPASLRGDLVMVYVDKTQWALEKTR